MILFTKKIERKAQAQYHLGSDLEKQVVIAKFFNPQGAGTWYLLNQDPDNPEYCWGIYHIFETEVGSFSKSDLETYKGNLGIGIERDLGFVETNAKELFHKLAKCY